MIELINFIKMRWDEFEASLKLSLRFLKSDLFPKTTIKFVLNTCVLYINRSIIDYRTLGSYSIKLIKMVLV